MSKNKRKLTALVADDHWVVRSSLKALLDTEYELTCFDAENAAEALTCARMHASLDLIVLDLSMPGGSSLSIIPQLRQAAPKAAIAIFSVSENRVDVLKSLEHGAAGYIPKTAEATVILSTVERLLRGEVALPQRLLVSDDPVTESVLVDDDDMSKIFTACNSFTKRQEDVFRLLASGASNTQIANDLGLSPNTVRVHLQAISSKLSAKGRDQMVLFASRWVQRSAA
ncbi:MAG: response regulator transcription factor [Pseudomonadota bacterium]